MSKEYNSALQARVEQFLKEKNISQAKAAPLMGISQTALSQYRRSMYDNGDISALESKLEEFFRTQEEQEARFAQLFSRIRMNRYYSTRKVTEQDVAKLFPKLAEEGRKKELNFLHGISQSKWGIRGAVNVYNNAVNNEDISYDGLYAMARTMGIGLV